MRIRTLFFTLVFWLFALPAPWALGADLLASTATPTVTATAVPTAAILSPAAGQAVQGRIPILGYTAVQAFRSAELSFGYAGDPTGTWFLIAQSAEPLLGTEMGAWDTNLITDGDYDLRLVVVLQDGTQVEQVVRGLRVRNYSPVETETPVPVTPTDTPLPGEAPTATITPTPTITSTPTLLPTNPAVITADQIEGSLGKGAAGVAVAFLILGFYLLIRAGSKRKNRLND